MQDMFARQPDESLHAFQVAEADTAQLPVRLCGCTEFHRVAIEPGFVATLLCLVIHGCVIVPRAAVVHPASIATASAIGCSEGLPAGLRAHSVFLPVLFFFLKTTEGLLHPATTTATPRRCDSRFPQAYIEFITQVEMRVDDRQATGET